MRGVRRVTTADVNAKREMREERMSGEGKRVRVRGNNRQEGGGDQHICETEQDHETTGKRRREINKFPKLNKTMKL